MDLIAFAHQMAAQSLDPSTKVGAVIAAPDLVVGTGFNHLPWQAPEEWWNDREKKYKAVVHAEVAAILDAGKLARGCTMYVTHHPCRECAKVIAAAGIACVVCPAEPWRDDPAVRDTVEDAKMLLEVSGVQMVNSKGRQ